jgi:DNA topoisomerase VI B subunit
MSGAKRKTKSADLNLVERNEPVVANNFRVRSPAEFFAENKNIAGFDNDGRSLYTTLRELVENGLDAAEAAEVLPTIQIRLEELSSQDFHSRLGLGGIVRRDMSIYRDFHERRKLAQEKAAVARRRKRKTQTISGAEDIMGEASSSVDTMAATAHAAVDSNEVESAEAVSLSENVTDIEHQFFVVSVQDNGTGIRHSEIPQMFGIVLAGTKYVVQQSRGKFGLGSKMALLWSKMSTGLPIRICSATDPNQPVSLCVLDIDIAANAPRVLVHQKLENTVGFRGTEVSVTIRGNWKTYRSYILQYLRHMAIITPYAEFFFYYRAAEESKNFELFFSRRSESVPPRPKQVKHHPSSVNQLVLHQLMAAIPPHTKLVEFLANELSSISMEFAHRLIEELGPPFSLETTVAEIKGNKLRHLFELLRQAHFPPPNGDCLSPAGEYNLRLGIVKELGPELVATHSEPVGVLDGHPFIVEVGVSVGGSKVKPGINVFRFANRIPLLFEGGNDVVTKTANKLIPWSSYKMNPITDRIGVFCSIVSTRCPFKGTGKEYIGADAEPIQKSVRHAIMQCCQQLRTKLVKKSILQERQERKKRLAKYVPHVARAIHQVLHVIADRSHSQIPKSSQKTHGQELISAIREGKISEAVLQEHLLRHIAETETDECSDVSHRKARAHMQYVYPGVFRSITWPRLRLHLESSLSTNELDTPLMLYFPEYQKAEKPTGCKERERESV